MKVYRKKSTFKGAKENDYYYSGTTSNGKNVILKFNMNLPDGFKDASAFEVCDIMGTSKKKTVEKDDKTYTNYIYYVKDCKFKEIDPEPLEF